MKKLFLILIALFTLNIYSQDTIRTLDEVVLNGVRASKKAPISEKTLSFDEISKTNVTFEPSNILSRTPSVTMSTDNGTPFGYTYFRIRGIDQTRINMTLNGVPLNEPEDQGVFFSNMPSFMENIESLQVQRGVGTTSNGTASFGGSINFQTANYTNKGGSFKYDVGSFGTHRVTSTFSTGLRGKFAFNVAGSIYQTNGYRYDSGSEGAMVYLNTGYFGETYSIKLTSILGQSMNEMAWLGVSEDDINNNPRTNYNSGNAKDNFMQSLTILEFKNKFNDNTSLTSSLFYNRLEGSYDYNMLGDRDLSLESNFYGIVNNLSVKFDNVKLDYGISANDYTRKHFYTFDVPNNQGNKKEYATYLKLKLNMGIVNVFYDTQIRHTIFDYKPTDITFGDIDKKHWTFINPKGGLNVNINSKSTLFYSLGLSHREPTRTTMFGGLDFLVDGLYMDIKPESVLDHELGYKYFSDKFNIKGNLFFMDYKNELIPMGGLLANGVPMLTQYEKSYRKGIELDFDLKISKNISLSNNQTLMTSRIGKIELDNGDIYTDKQSVLTPNYISNTTLSYNNSKGYFVNIFNRVQSKSYLDIPNQYSIPSFVTFDLNFGYRATRYMGMLTIGNVTNQKYYTNGNMTNQFFEQTNTRHLFVNPPFNLFLTLKYNL